jgi:hypothetical protein
MTDGLVTICAICQKPCRDRYEWRGEPVHPHCRPERAGWRDD